MDKHGSGTVSRRSFFRGAAGGAAVVAGFGLMGNPVLAASLTALPEKWDYEADVVVIGFGGSGAAAAVAAAEAGAEVLILEKMEEPGGDTKLCGGAVYGAGTSVQEELGIEDSAEAMKEYYEVIKPGLNRPEFIEVMSEGSADAVEWLINYGAEIPATEGLPGITIGGFERLHEDVTPAVPRSHWVVGGGKSLFAAFANAVDEHDIEYLLETKVERLIFNPTTGEVAGVRATNNDEEITVKARKAIVIATGGWTHNTELLTAFAPGGASFLGAKGSEGSVGDGLKMAMEAGADLWATHDVLLSMGLVEAPNAYFTPFMEYTLIVNQEAKRFISEGAWTQDISEETLKQPGATAFLIFDSDMRERSEFDVTLSYVVPEESVVEADSIEELAEMLELDAEALQATLDEYNEHVDSGEDPLGKTEAELLPIKTAPFYAIKSQPLPVITTGGVLTDVEAHVLNPYGEIINRLYAVGEVTGGKLVGYPGCGTSITDCIIFGAAAGKAAAAEEDWE